MYMVRDVFNCKRGRALEIADDMKSWQQWLISTSRSSRGLGERPAVLVIDMNCGAVGENRPNYDQVDEYPETLSPTRKML